MTAHDNFRVRLGSSKALFSKRGCSARERWSAGGVPREGTCARAALRENVRGGFRERAFRGA